MTALLMPRPLRPGDTIGVAAPAGRPAHPERLAAGVAALNEMGYAVRLPAELWPGEEYLAGSDQRRADELHALFTDANVAAIIAVRGGFGCLRLLPYLDASLLAAHPKMLVGFSDISILLNHLGVHFGMVSLHGPVLTSLGDASPAARQRLQRCLQGHWNEPIDITSRMVLRHGESVSAPFFGGNLASLVSLIGTPFDFPWQRKVIFLEEVNEPPYRVDRLLTQLFLAGKFRGLAGLLLGDFSGLYPPEDQRNRQYLDMVLGRVAELCAGETYPIWANIPAGHRHDNQTLPFAATVRLEPEIPRLLFP